ncbi:hypothetical protein HDU67_001227 [Dinochytrium kinnereticum]|nr:hypothetical protein HDU67_001227 [Dinochytrium kinnereticum]
MYMHEWLLISLDLRRLAIEARNRRPEVYQILQQSTLKGGVTAGDDDDDDGDGDGEGDDESIRTGSADSKASKVVTGDLGENVSEGGVGLRLGSRGSLSGLGSGEIRRVQFSDRVETSDGEPPGSK